MEKHEVDAAIKAALDAQKGCRLQAMEAATAGGARVEEQHIVAPLGELAVAVSGDDDLRVWRRAGARELVDDVDVDAAERHFQVLRQSQPA